MDNKNPLVSVVFTSYNHKEFLRESLDSLVNQTYSNVEIIIIDDCSNDGSQDILKEYEHFKNLKLILNKQNSGSYVLSSNYGASFAKGDYIIFAQCDDFSELNQIERLVEASIKNLDCGVIFSSSRLIDEKGVFISIDFKGREKSFKKHIRTNSVIGGNEMSEFLSFSCVLPNLSAALIKHDLFKKVNGFSTDYLVVSDWDFWLKTSNETNFFYIKDPLNNFRQHDTTIRSSIKMKIQILEIEKMFFSNTKFKVNQNYKNLKFKIGFGSIWFAYFMDNKKQWINSFSELYKKINMPFLLFFLLLGSVKYVNESIYRKIFNEN